MLPKHTNARVLSNAHILPSTFLAVRNNCIVRTCMSIDLLKTNGTLEELFPARQIAETAVELKR